MTHNIVLKGYVRHEMNSDDSHWRTLKEISECNCLEMINNMQNCTCDVSKVVSDDSGDEPYSYSESSMFSVHFLKWRP